MVAPSARQIQEVFSPDATRSVGARVVIVAGLVIVGWVIMVAGVMIVVVVVVVAMMVVKIGVAESTTTTVGVPKMLATVTGTWGFLSLRIMIITASTIAAIIELKAPHIPYFSQHFLEAKTSKLETRFLLKIFRFGKQVPVINFFIYYVVSIDKSFKRIVGQREVV